MPDYSFLKFGWELFTSAAGMVIFMIGFAWRTKAKVDQKIFDHEAELKRMADGLSRYPEMSAIHELSDRQTRMEGVASTIRVEIAAVKSEVSTVKNDVSFIRNYLLEKSK